MELPIEIPTSIEHAPYNDTLCQNDVVLAAHPPGHGAWKESILASSHVYTIVSPSVKGEKWQPFLL